jgi:hypothetical protein
MEEQPDECGAEANDDGEKTNPTPEPNKVVTGGV